MKTLIVILAHPNDTTSARADAFEELTCGRANFQTSPLPSDPSSHRASTQRTLLKPLVEDVEEGWEDGMSKARRAVRNTGNGLLGALQGAEKARWVLGTCGRIVSAESEGLGQ